MSAEVNPQAPAPPTTVVATIEKTCITDKKRVCEFLDKVSKSYGRGEILNGALSIGSGAIAVLALVYGVLEISPSTAVATTGVVTAAITDVGGRLLLVWLLVTLAKLCFQFARVCLGECRRNNNRKQIVAFGQLYVDAEGQQATWETLAFVLKDWNRLDGDVDLDKIDPNIEAQMDGFGNVIMPKASPAVAKAASALKSITP